MVGYRSPKPVSIGSSPVGSATLVEYRMDINFNGTKEEACVYMRDFYRAVLVDEWDGILRFHREPKWNNDPGHVYNWFVTLANDVEQ